MLKLKAVTLNMWTIAFVSKDVRYRLERLTDALKQSDYDIVALQEIWSHRNYLRMANALKDTFGYGHYFHSGVIGSGCCIFSRHPIRRAFHHKYSLNGHPHRLDQGDWLGGKLVGLAVIDIDGIELNAYVTHLHANYSLDYDKSEYTDSYLAHRVTQLYELGQFIEMTSHAADVTLLLGDLNTYSTEMGYKLLCTHAQLRDPFHDKRDQINLAEHGATCYAKTNSYDTKPTVFPDGVRIDYVLYKCARPHQIQCLDYRTCFGKIPADARGRNYSDHEGVSVEFALNLHANSSADNQHHKPSSSSHPDVTYYHYARNVLERALHTETAAFFLNPSFWLFLACLGISLLLVFVAIVSQTFSLSTFFLLLVSILGLAYFFIARRIECKHLNRALDSLNLIIRSNHHATTVNEHKHS